MEMGPREENETRGTSESLQEVAEAGESQRPPQPATIVCKGLGSARRAPLPGRGSPPSHSTARWVGPVVFLHIGLLAGPPHRSASLEIRKYGKNRKYTHSQHKMGHAAF